MITLKNISKSFDVKGKQVPALRNIELEVKPGEIFGVIGHSGAGKSTLIRLINLLERPTSGELIVAGRNVTHLEGRELHAHRRGIGMIFQQFNLLNSRTVAENVAFPLQLAGGYDRKAIRTRVDALLARVGLSDFADRYPSRLSGGQKQRVGIARALACNPGILLCDEATSALDPQTTRSVLKLLAEINKELGLTIVLITHEMEVIRQVCDRVAVIDHGEIVEQGSVYDVLLHPASDEARELLSEAHDDPLPEATALVDGPVYRLTFRGEAAHIPVLGEIARSTGVDYVILSGRVDRIKDVPYGQLTVALIGGNPGAAVQRLRTHDIHVQALPVGVDPQVHLTLAAAR